MAQVQKTQTAQTANTLDLEVVARNPNLNYGRIVSKHIKTDNKEIPQDSAIDYNFDIVHRDADLNIIGIDEIRGTQTKGADCMTTKPQKGLTLKNIVDAIEGMNTPQAKAVGMQLLEAAVQDFETVEERVAWWASNDINWSKPTGALYKKLREATPTVKTGEVKVYPNA